MVNFDDEMQISDLARRAGVSVRTVRYYISEGLLPTPPVRGRYTVYDEDYLNRIYLIRYLKDAFLPLKEIRRMLQSLSAKEVENLLDQYQHGINPFQGQFPGVESFTPEPDSAVDYINNLLQTRGTGAQRIRETPSQPAKAVPEGKDSIPTNQQMPLPQQPVKPASESETYQRVLLGEGIELHIRRPLKPEDEERVERLIKRAKKIFDDSEN